MQFLGEVRERFRESLGPFAGRWERGRKKAEPQADDGAFAAPDNVAKLDILQHESQPHMEQAKLEIRSDSRRASSGSPKVRDSVFCSP
jgi:hypothetical protein